MPILHYSPERNYRFIADADDVLRRIEKQNAIAELHKTDVSVDQSHGYEVNYNYVIPQSFLYGELPDKTELYTIQNLSICDGLSCTVEVAELLGDRKTQEDAFVASSFKISTPAGQTHTVLLTGVLDGHGGREVADYVKENLQKKIENLFSCIFNNSLKRRHPLKELKDEQTLSDKLIWNVLKIACVELHDECTHPLAGTTAAFSLLIDGEDLWHVNVGDSRSIITSKEKTIQLSEDMRMRFNFASDLTKEAFDQIESDFKRAYGPEGTATADIKILQERIAVAPCNEFIQALLNYQLQKALLEKEKIDVCNSYERSIWKRGGYISKPEHRLNGGLAMPRSIGDKSLGNGICSRPKITKISLSKEFPDSEFCTLLHGCDGLWDVATTTQVAEAINSDPSPLAQVGVNLALASAEACRTSIFFDDPEPSQSDNISTVLTRIDLRALRNAREPK